MAAPDWMVSFVLSRIDLEFGPRCFLFGLATFFCFGPSPSFQCRVIVLPYPMCDSRPLVWGCHLLIRVRSLALPCKATLNLLRRAEPVDETAASDTRLFGGEIVHSFQAPKQWIV
jgi:hypothetical protein